ncbi:hypothetical protein PHMEG_00013332 [Phytophthora megakarya]|uniref:DDE Tnp4 domain-containing protein n=1 Tax=Phytophthora megakarya TaxID=4795 RepID=A0A225W6H9_9STRA|nr:hypothetical protein PHMEG_00013332 [Phytophthora megakarya]
MSDAESKDQFCFTTGEIALLVHDLNIPAVARTREGVRSTALEDLPVCLCRLAYPKRWIDVAGMFGRAPPSTLCHIFYYVVDFLDKNLARFLFFDTSRITKNISRYCAVIAAKEPSSIGGEWGFIDEIIRPIYRPNKGQQAVYNGHKRVNALKFQTVITPDGIIAHLFGPVDGRRHDLFILNESKRKDFLHNNSAFHNKLIYGEPAYGCTKVFCCPYKGCRINTPQKELNKAMSSVRVSVEWSYAEVTKYFLFLDYKRHQRAVMTPRATLNNLGGFFTNCVTIVNGCNTNSRYFRCKALSIWRLTQALSSKPTSIISSSKLTLH